MVLFYDFIKYNSLEIIWVFCGRISQFKEIIAVSPSFMIYHVVVDVLKLKAAGLLNVPYSALHQLSPAGQAVDRPVKRVGNRSVLPQPSDIGYYSHDINCF